MKQLDKIIYISGVARSGTSWVAQILNSSPDICFRFQPFFSYEFKDRVSEESSKEELEKIFSDLYGTDTEFLTQKNKQESGEYPTFEKNKETSILAFKENKYQSVIEPALRRVDNLFGVGVIRNPCAVINSWRNNVKEFPEGSDIMKEWRFANCKNIGNEDYFGYYKWKEVANLYLDLEQKYPDRFKILHYVLFFVVGKII